MKALFNKNENASDELKELLGFLDVAIKYKNIKQEINASTREIQTLLSKPIYDQLYADYIEGRENDLIELVQYPIALNAYRQYAPNGDVSHTNNGRRMRMDENEKQAFEWLLDRDNNALERKYYRALDTLINYLIENHSEWKNTEAYSQLASSIFKTTEEFDTIFPINSRFLLLKLIPGVKRCLDFDIKSRITPQQMKSLLSKPEELDPELVTIIKTACAYYALAWAMPRLSVQLFPEGMLQGYVSDKITTQSRKPTLKNELAYARENFENDYKEYLLKLEEFVSPQKTVQSTESTLQMHIAGDKYLST